MIDLVFFLGGIGIFFLFSHFCKKNQNEAIEYFVFEDGLIANFDNNTDNNNTSNNIVPPLYNENERLPSYDETFNSTNTRDFRDNVSEI